MFHIHIISNHMLYMHSHNMIKVDQLVGYYSLVKNCLETSHTLDLCQIRATEKDEIRMWVWKGFGNLESRDLGAHLQSEYTIVHA